MPCYSHLSGPMCVYNRIWGGGLNNTEEAVFIFQPKFYSNIGMMIIFPCIMYICTIWWRSIVQCTAQEKLQECSFVVSGELIAFFLASSEKPERFKKKRTGWWSLLAWCQVVSEPEVLSVVDKRSPGRRFNVQLRHHGESHWQERQAHSQGGDELTSILATPTSNFQSFRVYQFSLGSWRLRRNRGCFRGSLVVPSKRRREWWVLVYFELQNIL